MEERRKFCRNCGTQLEDGVCPECQKRMPPANAALPQDEGQSWPSNGITRHVAVYRNWDTCYKKSWLNVEINGVLEGSLKCDELFEFETDRECIDVTAYVAHEKDEAQTTRVHLDGQTFLVVSGDALLHACSVAKVDALPLPDDRALQKKYAIAAVTSIESIRSLKALGVILAIVLVVVLLVGFAVKHDWSKSKDTKTPASVPARSASYYPGY